MVFRSHLYLFVHEIICLHVSFTTGAVAFTFGPGVGPIALENVSCNGAEANLLQCSSDMTEGSSSQCLHHAGAVCERKWISGRFSNVVFLTLAWSSCASIYKMS